MKVIKKSKQVMFGAQEIIWIFVHRIEDWLYPYCDRPVESLNDEYGNDEVDDISNIYSQLESANERIQRLQYEMMHVQSVIHSLTDKKK